MKRRLTLLFLCMLMVIACAFGLVACGEASGDASVDGTYYLYENGQYDKSQYFTLSGGKWTDDDSESGTYTVSGTTIMLYTEIMGEKEEMASGTVSGGVLTVDVMGSDWVYCKDGVKPSSGKTDDDKPVATTKYTVIYDANGGTFAGGETTYTQSDIAANSTLTAPTAPTKINCTLQVGLRAKTVLHYGSLLQIKLHPT